jgi:hypothetical protein
VPGDADGKRLSLSSLTYGQWLWSVSAVGVLLSLVLSWIDYDFLGRKLSKGSTAVPVEFLFDKGAENASPSILVLLIPSLVLLTAAIVTKARIPAFIGGAVSVMVAVLYGVQINSMLDDVNKEVGGVTNIGLFDFIGIAPYFALVGGVLGLLGVLLWRPAWGSVPADQ